MTGANPVIRSIQFCFRCSTSHSWLSLLHCRPHWTPSRSLYSRCSLRSSVRLYLLRTAENTIHIRTPVIPITKNSMAAPEPLTSPNNAVRNGELLLLMNGSNTSSDFAPLILFYPKCKVRGLQQSGCSSMRPPQTIHGAVSMVSIISLLLFVIYF